MKIRVAALVFAFLSVLIGGCAQGPAPAVPPANGVGSGAGAETPYAGWETRPIKALAPDRVEDLLAGRGAGYALAAELNHYPGPAHALALAPQLGLNPEQESRVAAIFAAMRQETQPLGRALVDREAELDRKFREASITEPELRNLTGEIATVEGQLRSAHLAAHLKLKEVLTPEQAQRYDQLRGYGSAATTGTHDHNSMQGAH